MFFIKKQYNERSFFFFIFVKTLIFIAQPSSKGLIRQMAKQYEGTVKTKGEDVEIIDLYEEQYQMPFLQFEDQKAIPENAARTLLQSKISESDHLVFFFPMWWGEYPAIMKNFIDNVFMPGYAFKFKDGRPVGLLTKKTAEVYMTCGAPRWYYFIFGFPFKKLFTSNTLKFCGISVRQFRLFGNAEKVSPEKKSEILQKITSYALS